MSDRCASRGIVSLGVLVDIPALLGVEWLDFGHAIGPTNSMLRCSAKG